MRQMNKAMLNVIIATQARKWFVLADSSIAEDAGQGMRDWFKETEGYYTQLPDTVLAEAGLHKNRNDFEEVVGFTVTPEMRSTSYEDLGRFEFPSDPLGEYGTAAGPGPR